MLNLKDLEQLQWQKDCAKTKMPSAYVPKTKFSDKTANGLTKCVCAYINLMGGMAERINNTGRFLEPTLVTDCLGRLHKMGKGKWIPGTGRNGRSDVGGIYKSRPLAVEIKIGKDRMSQAQIEYKEEFEKAGGVYIIAREFEQFVKDLEERV